MNKEDDPVLQNEGQLESALIAGLGSRLSCGGTTHVIIRHFGLDIGVFVRDAIGTRARFIEAKCFSAAAGRVGFGNQIGDGIQVDVLLRSTEQLQVLDEVIRWVLLDVVRPRRSPRYAVFDCSNAHAAASGGVAHGKQNNLRVSSFVRDYITWSELLDRLVEFVTN